MREYWGSENPPERVNLQFMMKLRNKIEHRNHPELDPGLYGECQAMLMNFEDLLTERFGRRFALAEDLGIALQFSLLRSSEQEEALRRLAGSSTTDVREFIDTFRADLPNEVSGSPKYSLGVYLVPKTVRNQNAADLAVQIVWFDESDSEERAAHEQLVAMIREKHIPVASKGLMKPSEVKDRLSECLPHKVTMDTHRRAWQYYEVRPPERSDRPERTKPDFCVYDALSKGYGYTKAWVKYLCRKLADPAEFEAVTGKEPIPKEVETPAT